MADATEFRPMHLTICVADRDRAVNFYTKALSFVLRHELEQTADYSPMFDLHDIRYRDVFLTNGTMVLALHAFESPPVLPAAPHAYNRAGFTQFAFGVDDIETASRFIVEHGGTVIEASRKEVHGAVLMAFNDPDGTRLELVQRLQ